MPSARRLKTGDIFAEYRSRRLKTGDIFAEYRSSCANDVGR